MKVKRPKSPFRRGARVTNGRNTYKVLGSTPRRCHCCEGTGLQWTFRLRGPTGNFETGLDSLRKGGYTRVERKAKEKDDV
jgi:hypothetical protein